MTQLYLKLLFFDTESDEVIEGPVMDVPPEVDLTTMDSYVQQHYGEVIIDAYTELPSGERVEVGWVFQAVEPVGDRGPEGLEVWVMPMFVDPANGELTSVYVRSAQQHQEFEELAGKLGTKLEVIEVSPQRWTAEDAD